MHRVIAVTETMFKKDISRCGLDNSDIMKEVDAEETVSRQDVSIRSLKRENSVMRKQLESVRLQMAEKGEEVET